MKTLFPVVIAILVVVACARAGDVFWRHYQLHDAVEQETRYGAAKSTDELYGRVLKLAEEYSIALDEEEVSVSTRSGQAIVSVNYIEPIALVPYFYTREQPFGFDINVKPIRPLKDSRAAR